MSIYAWQDSSSSPLAGNLTLSDSVANLIVAESARNRGINLSFIEHLKPGAVITLATLIVESYGPIL